MTDSDFLHQVELHLSLASKIKQYEPITAKLDGSIKKNTSFIKKLKQGITAQQLPSLLQELSALKVDKYLEEICSSITDFTYKTTSDIWAAVELSSVLYCRYEEFRVMLCTSLLKTYGQLLKSNTENAKDEQMRLGKIKSNLKFLTELYMVGMIMEDKSKNLVPNLLKFLLVGDKELKHCHVAFAFSKAYSMYLLPNNICSQQGIEFMKIEKRDALLNAGQREKCYVLLSDYFEKVKEALLKEHLKLQNLQISNEANFIARGEINQDKVDQLTIREKQLEKSKFGAQSMATSLFLEMCEFPQQEKQIEFTIGIAENLPRDGIDGDSIWEDLESKTFYENVIDLSNLVPAVLLGKKQTKVVEEVKIEFDEGKAIENVDEPVSEMEGDGVSVEVEQEDSPEISGTKAQMEEIMTQLNSSLSKEAVDQIAVKFAFINNKGTRKRLAQALLAVPRQRLDLLPHYARLLATLDPYMPSLTLLVTKELESSFRYHQRKKDQLFFEEKIKNIKFIAELCKFQIISHVSVFYCLKVLLDKFAFHNIEILCAMLETCGRFLYFKPETQLIMAKFLDILVKKKMHGSLDTKYVFMIENAIYSCNPPTIEPAKVKHREPIEHFIRKIIYKDLKRTNVEESLILLKKIDWNNEAVRKILVKVFCKIWKIKFSNIHLMAFMLSELCRFYPEVGISVVDNTLEEIRVGLEMNIFRHNQKRVSCVKYLGELYNYRIVDAGVMFDTLFLLLRFGYPNGIPVPGVYTPIDDPKDFFRLRLVCTLIDSCGSSFRRGINARKLDAFLIFMQLYIFTKDTVPVDAEFFIMETLDNIRPGMGLIPSYEVAAEMMNNLAKTQPTHIEIQSEDELEEEDQFTSESEEEVNELEEDIETHEEEDEELLLQMTSTLQSDDESVDEEFEREFGRLMQDSMDSRRRERKPANFDAPVPTKRSTFENTDETKVTFTLLTKKGNKQQVCSIYKIKALLLPTDSSLAIQTRSNQEAETQERTKLKKLVLSYERDQVEPEGQYGNQEYFNPVDKVPHRENYQNRRPRGGPGSINFGDEKTTVHNFKS